MNCFYHPNVKGVYRCDNCDRAICDEDKKEIFLDNKGLEVTNATSGIIKTYCFICYLDSKCLILLRKRQEAEQLIFFIATFFILLPLLFTLYNIIYANRVERQDFLRYISPNLVFLMIPIYFILREILVIKKTSKKSKKYMKTKKEFLNSISDD